MHNVIANMYSTFKKAYKEGFIGESWPGSLLDQPYNQNIKTLLASNKFTPKKTPGSF